MYLSIKEHLRNIPSVIQSEEARNSLYRGSGGASPSIGLFFFQKFETREGYGGHN